MHLSFIDYDREENQLGIHREDMVSPTVKQTGLDSFSQGPNGFLRRKSDENNMGYPLFKPKAPSSTFSALGNKAATPGKAKSQQERQLISGRDFRDILEACRPRVSGMRLPSALASILRLHNFVEESEKARLAGVPFEFKRESALDHNKDTPLREWGTIHFNEFPVRAKPKSFRSDSPTSRRSPSEQKIDKNDDSESGSHASSFMSHVSSVFGMSYDRVLWDHYDSPLVPRTSFQIQRSSSLEFDRLNPALLTEGGDSGVGDDYLSVDTDNASGGQASAVEDSDWNQADNDTTASHQSKQERQIDTLRKLMDAHDEEVWSPRSTKIPAMGDINVIRPESLQHVESEVTIASTKRGQNMSGASGLGAALSQYSSAIPSEGQPNTILTRRASGTFLPNPGRSGGTKDRTRAQSPLLPVLTQFQDRAARGMSPMLYPPMLNFASGHHQNTTDPPSIMKGERTPGIASNRSFVMDRDALGLAGAFSSSNYEYGGIQSTMVRSVYLFIGRLHLHSDLTFFYRQGARFQWGIAQDISFVLLLEAHHHLDFG
jgi:hypothetical protein